MHIICASINYRGYADDEVAATLDLAPAIGYQLMEIHGPLMWSVPAVDAFDLRAFQTRLAQSSMRCAGIYTPGWGGVDNGDMREHARAVAACVRFAEILGCHHVTSTGASRRGEPGGLERVSTRPARLEPGPADSTVRLTLEPHYGNVLEQPEDFERVLNALPDRRWAYVWTGHFHAAHVDTVAFIRRFTPRIYAVHVKDHCGSVSVGIGRGEIDFLPRSLPARGRLPGRPDDRTRSRSPHNLPRISKGLRFMWVFVDAKF